MPIKNPSHPGDFIRTKIIDPAGLSVTAADGALHTDGGWVYVIAPPGSQKGNPGQSIH